MTSAVLLIMFASVASYSMLMYFITVSDIVTPKVSAEQLVIFEYIGYLFLLFSAVLFVGTAHHAIRFARSLRKTSPPEWVKFSEIF